MSLKAFTEEVTAEITEIFGTTCAQCGTKSCNGCMPVFCNTVFFSSELPQLVLQHLGNLVVLVLMVQASDNEDLPVGTAAKGTCVGKFTDCITSSVPFPFCQHASMG